jgi:replicative DNA helicase
MVADTEREILDEKLAIWRGPLPFNLAAEPKCLVELGHHFNADAILIDSAKDVLPDLSKEESGLALNAAFQHTVAEGIEVGALHHQRKQQTGAGKPRHLSDVYGSRWITAGAGSVVMLWGEAGGLVVEFDHLKQPDEIVGPFQVLHDHVNGVSTLADSVDALSIIKRARSPLTAAAVAADMFSSPTPDRNEIEKARRQLDRLAKEGRIREQDGRKGGRGGGDAALYSALTVIQEGRK